MTTEHAAEIEAGERFAFGENWARFLQVLDDGRIAQAERSLKDMLAVDDLRGRRFLDVGSGSGLFSLAARRLGAEVRSFDYDPASVACTDELKRRYVPGDPRWSVGRGSVLDRDFVAGLGSWDIVYSWGVLHHTGAMWQALDNVVPLVAPGGKLFIAIYNDQGWRSRAWLVAKKTYNRLPAALRPLYTLAVMGPRQVGSFARACLKGRPLEYLSDIKHYAETSARGMSYWHDVVDWIGGYPFEVATPDAIIGFYRDRGFTLRRLVSRERQLGCNEFVFLKG